MEYFWETREAYKLREENFREKFQDLKREPRLVRTIIPFPDTSRPLNVRRYLLETWPFGNRFSDELVLLGRLNQAMKTNGSSGKHFFYQNNPPKEWDERTYNRWLAQEETFEIYRSVNWDPRIGLRISNIASSLGEPLALPDLLRMIIAEGGDVKLFARDFSTAEIAPDLTSPVTRRERVGLGEILQADQIRIAKAWLELAIQQANEGRFHKGSLRNAQAFHEAAKLPLDKDLELSLAKKNLSARFQQLIQAEEVNPNMRDLFGEIAGLFFSEAEIGEPFYELRERYAHRFIDHLIQDMLFQIQNYRDLRSQTNLNHIQWRAIELMAKVSRDEVIEKLTAVEAQISANMDPFDLLHIKAQLAQIKSPLDK